MTSPSETSSPSVCTEEQRKLFADVRANEFVRNAEDGLRSPQEMLGDPGVAATVLYRMSQNQKLSKGLAEAAFYAPFASDMIPDGISPAVVLGAFRNLQAKVLGVWANAVAQGRDPVDIIDLVELYADAFPKERKEAIRMLLVTTFGATVKAGGVSMAPADAREALAELTVLAAEVAAKKRSLRAAMDDSADL